MEASRRIRAELLEAARLFRSLAQNQVHEITRLAGITSDALRRGNKLLLCGNGGSATAAQHLAAELVSRFRRERSGLPVIALTPNAAVLTAVGNDYRFERIFARQVEALGKGGDVLWAFSTSGRSPNVLEAAGVARARGMEVLAFTGAGGGRLGELANAALFFPSRDAARIQEGHLAAGHIICGLIEEELFGEPGDPGQG